MTLKRRGIILVALTIVMILVCEAVVVYRLRSTMYEEKKGAAQDLVGVAHSIIEHYNELAISGKIPLETAKQEAINEIKALNYEKGKQYIWINDIQPKVVMHPFENEMYGKDLSNYIDAKGKRFFLDFVSEGKKQNGGFVDYFWPKPGEKDSVRKTSFVKEFKPWGWDIGSGIYLDDVDIEVKNNAVLFIVIISVFGIIYGSVVFLFAGGMAKDLSQLVKLTTNLPDKIVSRETIKWPKSPTTEICILIENFKTAAEKLRQSFGQIEHDKNEVEARTQQFSDINKALEKEIMERVQIELELVEAREAALKSSSAKTEFLATISHEIRTPMNSIIGMADLLWETPLNSEQQDYIKIFRKAGHNLLNLINDLLDVSKIESGNLALEEINFDLKEFIKKTLEFTEVRAFSKGLKLEYTIEKDVPTCVVGDSGRLRQILVNLIDNAIKFTEKGNINLNVKCHGNDINTLLFSVSDTGIGISTENVGDIFKGYKQANSSISRKYGGTGLGLAICRQLVELLGGRIWVESKEKQGSTFYFTIKFKAEGNKCLMPEADFRGTRVLIVDQNLKIRQQLIEIFNEWGATTIGVESPEDAFDELIRSKEGFERFRIIILDSETLYKVDSQISDQVMKNLDISDITVEILNEEQARKDTALFRQPGIGSYLIKPFDREKLIEAISTALSKEEVAAVGIPTIVMPEDAKDQRALKILLVEDSEDNRTLIQYYFKDTKYQVDIAINGEEAVEKFKAGKYDIVLMDVQMPIMNGYTATRNIRLWEKENGLKETSIIALTAYALKEDVQRSIEAGCSTHITKPIKKQTLLKVIYDYSRDVK